MHTCSSHNVWGYGSILECNAMVYYGSYFCSLSTPEPKVRATLYGPLHEVFDLRVNLTKPILWWSHVQVLISCHVAKLGTIWCVLTARPAFPCRPLEMPFILFCENTITSVVFFLKTMIFTRRSKVPCNRPCSRYLAMILNVRNYGMKIGRMAKSATCIVFIRFTSS